MKIVIGQINTTPNDFAGNFKAINDCILENKDVDVIIFPELSIPGYLCKDLMYNNEFIRKNEQYLQMIAKETTDINATVIVGSITTNTSGYGKPFRNTANIIQRGLVSTRYHKQLLPFYDVFFEGRYFEPGIDLCVCTVNGKRCGIVICEDAFNDKCEDSYNYRKNPISGYRHLNVDYIFSLNSSPWYVGKERDRVHMFSKIVASFDNDITLVYVNQVGGQDELVFDGGSFIINGGKGFCETIIKLNNTEQNYVLDTDQRPFYLDKIYSKYESLRSNLVLGLRDYIRKSGFDKILVGSSGGVDSAVVLSLACEAIQPQNVYGLIMPTSNNESIDAEYAAQLHQNLGCNTLLFPIEYESLLTKLNLNNLGDYNNIADKNLQARLRDVVIMHYSNAYKLLPLATGNKTEASCGYYTLFDLNLGLAPIADLYKCDVRALAKLDDKIPQEIKDRKPTAGLARGQNDEDDLLPYEYLDKIVEAAIEHNIENYDDFKRFPNSNASHVTQKDYDRIIRLINVNEFKRRQSTLILKVSKKSFGNGRLFPVCRGY